MTSMLRSPSQYEVARPSGRCAATGRALAPGEPCIATLCEGEADSGFERLDFSLAAWEAGARPDRLFGYWKTTVPDPRHKRRVFVDDELLLNVFERLEGDDKPQRPAFRFVLGLILLRKRILKYAGRREESGGEVWLLRRRGADPLEAPILLINPNLSDRDLDAVTEQLSEILHGELL